MQLFVYPAHAGERESGEIFLVKNLTQVWYLRLNQLLNRVTLINVLR